MFARATRPLYRSLAPLGDRILIRKAVKETQTAGGILLPTDGAKQPNEGTVVAVGPGIRDVSGVLHAPTLKSGDNVLLPQYGGTEVEIGDEKLSLFREDDILGKFAQVDIGYGVSLLILGWILLLYYPFLMIDEQTAPKYSKKIEDRVSKRQIWLVEGFHCRDMIITSVGME